MGSSYAHKPNEVLVLPSASCIHHDVAYHFGIYLASSVESETNWHFRGLQIPVNSLWAPDDMGPHLLCPKVLTQKSRIRVGVIASDYHQTIQVQLRHGIHSLLELLGRLNLIPPTAYNVEPSLVPVWV
uniref:Uncharacterized protein n=1 Tax=Physcomitrium patens TaxID=3218 RepID=A0A2K1L170_PHYPA|nr:hypothetical protein PHYPA_002566 [Physcomitrium patens]